MLLVAVFVPHVLPKPMPIAYIDEAFSIYRARAIERCGSLFYLYFPMWKRDYYGLGMGLWRCRYILLAIPIVVGRHY